MTRAEYFNNLFNEKKDIDIQAIEIVLATLQDSYPKIKLEFFIPKYEAVKVWLEEDEHETE